MIEKETVLVLGAGASAEYGFPTGAKLIEEIHEKLKAGTSERDLWMRCMCPLGLEEDRVDEFQKSLYGAEPPSLDSYLVVNPEFEKEAAALTALGLMVYETKEALGRRDGLYTCLYHRMGMEGGILYPDRFEWSTNRLTIITFNYDRSLEYFLFGRLASLVRSESKAREMVKRLRIIHMYGLLGKPDFLLDSGSDCLPYGVGYDDRKLKTCMENMWMITEDSPKVIRLNPLANPIEFAEVVCFLGFRYAGENLDRLRIEPGWITPNKFYGTAYHLPPDEKKALLHRFGGNITLGGYEQKSLDFVAEQGIL